MSEIAAEAPPREKADLRLVLAQVPLLKAIAAELFCAPVKTEIESDPEMSGCRYITFEVAISDRTAAAALRSEWYLRTARILDEDCDKVRLVIDVTP